MPPFGFILGANWNELVATVNRIDKNVTAILQQMEINMAAIDDALAAAEAAAKSNADAEDAVITLLGTLSAQIAALAQGSTDPAVTARIQALADGLTAKTDALAAAIVANTPARANRFNAQDGRARRSWPADDEKIDALSTSNPHG